ncbi:tRNA G10 N-methylase Trm11 [Chryseomicrobium aureum]|uniref:TRM11 family SAM-dependent methyltransferase n=1 Tax=Chryseomicrobium aureum TaxID=1441723 RepID=UPI00195854B9|nr:RsmD family RNA methyltransferase [Chryseomicrobium aureum]MBM7707477.1 tRNA G10 N-methylase Trm11 [Chryseomicrobium aureum]
MMAPFYIYTYGYNPEEGALAEMEIRAFFGQSTVGKVIGSSVSIDPSRSVFIREKLHVLKSAVSVDEIIESAKDFGDAQESYKVVFMKHEGTTSFLNEQRLQLARTIGNEMPGPLEMKTPDQVYAVTVYEGRWYFGLLERSRPVWMEHVAKPQGYSTALNARTARTLVNIANPHARDLALIDPCCGIGTVLVEAASMGMFVKGRDKNPLACVGARENLEHYNYPVPIDVEIRAIQEEEGHYDVAFLDLPYNLYTHSTETQQHDLIRHAARLADKVIIVTIESMDTAIEAAGLRVVDRATTTKQRFTREIVVCETSNR